VSIHLTASYNALDSSFFLHNSLPYIDSSVHDNILVVDIAVSSLPKQHILESNIAEKERPSSTPPTDFGDALASNIILGALF
jgi:hypothetical protein